MLSAFLTGFKSDFKKYPIQATILRAIRRTRILPMFDRLEHLRCSKSFQLHLAKLKEKDVLAVLSNRHYLARTLTPSQRVATAACHYGREDAQFDDVYLETVYGGRGLLLWASRRDGVLYEMRLMAGNDVMYEGALSVVFFAEGGRICVMSFTLIPSEIALPDSPANGRNLFFVSRKQLTQTRAYQSLFNQHFDRSTPGHMCFYAIAGLAAAQGISQAVGIDSTRHPSYNDAFHEQFEKSYTAFWASLSGRPVSPLGYLLNLPPQLPPMEPMGSAKRRRARLRRSHGEEILRATQSVITGHLRPFAPG